MVKGHTEMDLPLLDDGDGLDFTITPTSLKRQNSISGEPYDMEDTPGMRWVDMVLIAGPKECEIRLRDAWTQAGLAAALTATMSFAGLFTVPKQDGKGDDDIRYYCTQIYGMTIVLSFIFSLLSVAMSVMLCTRLNMLPRP